jgi:dTDP-4-amino-4,6-dideoxygalactose transaminase
MAPLASHWASLAVFGNKPAFAEPLHVGRPNLPDKQAILDRIAGALDRHWLTNGGPLVAEFEHRVAQQLGVRHCVAVANGTIALELAIRALGLTGEVILPSYTFIATAHALSWQQVSPVFGDVDRVTHTIDAYEIDRLITPRTTAILGVHLWGRGCNVEELSALAAERGLTLFFDAAHAFGCTYRGQPIGRFGACEVFSFHATKFVHCGEGGAVTTNNDELADRLRLLRNFGFVGYDCVTAIGTNGKMSELSAAVGLTSLDCMAAIVTANQAIHATYRRELAGLRGVRLLAYEPNEASNYQYVVLEVDERSAGLSRDELAAVLAAENVLARRYFFPGCHRMEAYRGAEIGRELELPVTEYLAERVLVLPTGLQVDESSIVRIAGILRTAVENALVVRGRLSQRRAA